MDPFIYTFPKIFPKLSPLILIILRTISAAICVAEASRFFAVLYPFCLHIVELEVRCIEIIANIPYKYFNREIPFLRWYNSLQIAHQTLHPSLSLNIALILGIGFIIIIAGNLGTIRAYNVLPLEVYWLMPIMAVTTICFSSFVFLFAVKINEWTKKIIQERKDMMFKNRSMFLVYQCKIIKKKYAAIRPIHFSCGIIFDLERGTDSNYFYWVFLRTIDSLLI